MTIRSLHAACLVFTAVIAGSMLSGCADSAIRTSRLDSNGLTIVTLNDPIVLALPAHQLAAAARDYAYLGPVEINRAGARSYLLWIGLASTIDRKLVDVPPAEARLLALLIDGQPLTLPLLEWMPGLDRPPYKTAAPLYATFAAHASLDQIRRIAGAESVEVHLVPESGVDRRYRKWKGDWSSWSSLVAAE